MHLELPLGVLTTGALNHYWNTRQHPFYVSGKGFVPAGGLAVGNAIVTRAGPTLTVKSIQWHRRAEGWTVYNFEVESGEGEDTHNYFVGKQNGGAWVHNIECTDLAYNLLKKRGEGSILRVEISPKVSGGIPRRYVVAQDPKTGTNWYHHDVFMDTDGLVHDPMRQLSPMSLDDWFTSLPYPDVTDIRYVTPDDLRALRRNFKF